MKIPFSFLKREVERDKKKFLKYLISVIDSGKYILGENVNLLEQKIAEFLGVNYVITVNSGTDAIILCLKAHNIMAGDEVITVSNTFIATIGAIIAVGAKPVLIDVGDDLLINPEKIEDKITAKTKVILPVHLTGRPAHMKKINQLAEKYSLIVIDDAAQSFGAEYYGKRFFNTHATCYSFHPYKTFHCLGDGGAIATNNKDLCDSLIRMRNHGISKDGIESFGYNSRLDEIQASILLATLPFLKPKIAKRQEIAQKYIHALTGIVDVPVENPSVMDPAYQTFIIKTDKRNSLASYLREKRIETAIHYPVPCHKHAAFADFVDFYLPVTEMQADRILSLPISHLLTKKEQDYTISSIKDFFNGTHSVR